MSNRHKALESFETERGPIVAGHIYEVEDVSAAGHFLRLKGHSAFVRASRFQMDWAVRELPE